MISIITTSFRFALASRRVIIAIYIFQLLLALTIGLQVYHIIDHSLAHSISLENMVIGFDYSILSDLINNHGASISPMIGQVRWHILFYLFCSVFINGGLLILAERNENNFNTFFNGAVKYFIPFLKIALITLVLFILWTALVWLPFLGGFFSNIEKLDRESPLMWAIPIILFIFLIGLGIIYLISVYMRLSLVRNEANVWRSFLSATRNVFINFVLYIKPLIFLFLSFILITGIHLVAGLYIGIRSTILVLLFLLLQQILALLKIAMRPFAYRLLVLHWEKDVKYSPS